MARVGERARALGPSTLHHRYIAAKVPVGDGISARAGMCGVSSAADPGRPDRGRGGEKPGTAPANCKTVYFLRLMRAAP